jgi:hypothetical protein
LTSLNCFSPEQIRIRIEVRIAFMVLLVVL